MRAPVWFGEGLREWFRQAKRARPEGRGKGCENGIRAGGVDRLWASVGNAVVGVVHTVLWTSTGYPRSVRHGAGLGFADGLLDHRAVRFELGDWRGDRIRADDHHPISRGDGLQPRPCLDARFIE